MTLSFEKIERFASIYGRSLGKERKVGRKTLNKSKGKISKKDYHEKLQRTIWIK